MEKIDVGLDPTTEEEVDRISREKGISREELLRELIRKGLDVQTERQQ